MRSQIKLGRIFGIEIGLHYSWFFIALLIVFSLFRQFHVTNQDWSDGAILIVSIATGVLFFVSLLLHELSHSLFAKSRGLPVREITLFALGGVSQIEKNPSSAKTEFWMAFVGPLSSVCIGLICFGLRTVAGPASGPAYAMLSWLGYINLALAGFNMIPGYPLDGGRILRAAIWWKSGDAERSTRIAARVGQIVGGVFIAFGIVQFFGGAGFGGLWIAFIGWFILQAASESYLQVGLAQVLSGVIVEHVMTRDCQTVDGNLNLQLFVDETLLRTGNRCFIVLDNSGFAGLVTPHEIKEIDRARWPYTTLFDIMRPLEEIRTVTPKTPLKEALEIMSSQDLNQLPVVSNRHVDGVLTRAQVLNYLHTRTELQA
jgi:Zn-dependent protease/predicted transcriptional regulator